MKKVLHPANERGYNNLGWLKSWHSFSFGQFYNPDKIHFGALRVVNDDFVSPSMGFGMHPHDNMEIITIILSGQLEHKDSMGNKGVINAGEVQVMSAGTGIRHSEYNPSNKEEVNLFQVWVFPKNKDIEPRYDQKSFTEAMKPDQLTTLISPDKTGEALWINQDSWFSMGEFEAGKQVEYTVNKPGNGVYVIVIDGEIKIDGTDLNTRDALGVYDTNIFSIETKTKSRLLIIEIPMN